MKIERQIRATPQVGNAPYRQIHPHSTGNPNSTAQNEADYMSRKDLNSGFYTHVVGNGRVIQTAEVGHGAYDVGGDWNYETYAAVELIQSHTTRQEFERDYRLYVELLRQLAKEAGIPLTLDTKDLAGIKTHMFCTYNQPNNGSDHIDPYPYLNQWGITVDQFERDLANGFGNANNNTNGNTETPNKLTTEKDDDIMYIYEVVRKNGKVEIWFMHGDGRWYLPTNEAVATAEAQLKKYGRSTARMRFNHDNYQLKQMEKLAKEIK
jgi:N-acetylmuramoyl-L-alanine amidase CwlA